jgi:hypothetical protein
MQQTQPPALPGALIGAVAPPLILANSSGVKLLFELLFFDPSTDERFFIKIKIKL